MKLLVSVGLLAASLCSASRHPFEIAQAGEVTAELDLRAPGADWAVKGREAAVAVLRLRDKPEHHLMVPADGTYRVFLGAFTAGKYELVVDRDPAQSAKGAELEVRAARFTVGTDPVLAHAPIVYARRNTVGRFSDVPMFAYCERLEENGQPVLVYTIVFSNEDGGTSTRALMARWGRTTDIEYVYRIVLKPDGSVARAIVQGRGHVDTDFDGTYDGKHPLLMPVTDNNMIAAATDSPLRFQLTPELVDLSRSSREIVMDRNPVLYELMSKELARENKLRKFGTVAAENISDVRNYAYVEYKATYTASAFTVNISLKDGRAFASDLGRSDYAINRPGWVRTTVELPPGTRTADIANVGFTCSVGPPEQKGGKAPHSGTCRLEQVGKVFFLTPDYKPGTSWLSVPSSASVPATVPTGQSVLFKP